VLGKIHFQTLISVRKYKPAADSDLLADTEPRKDFAQQRIR